jgi:hypothetical protein
VKNLYFILFLAYIVAPKFDLLGASAAVRPEDIISLITFGIWMLSRKTVPLQFPRPVKLYLVFLGICYLSALANITTNGLIGFVYTTRLVQYLLWFFVMYEACHRVTWRDFRRGLMAVSVIFILWGTLELLGVVGRIGRFTGAAERLTINTSGPFETSVLLAILAHAVPSFILTPVMLLFVLLTQARITLLGMIFSAGIAKPFKALLAGTAAVVVFTVVAQPLLAKFQDSRVVQSDSPKRMARVLSDSWRRAPVLDDPAQFRDRFLAGPTILRYMPSQRGDRSFAVRAVRWSIVLRTTGASIFHMLIGWGPGAWSLALDGYYVRVFGETGLIGLLFFLYWMFTTIFRLCTGSNSKFTLVMLAVVALFIDIFTSSKIMPLFWFFIALDHARHPFAMPRRLFGPALRPPPERRTPTRHDSTGRNRSKPRVLSARPWPAHHKRRYAPGSIASRSIRHR